MSLFRRQTQYCCDGLDCSPCNSSWNDWGRWVVAGVILAVGFLAILSISCINARRRRRLGLRPYTGTGWMAPPPYTPNPQYVQQPPPQYYAGQSQRAPDSYYGIRPQQENDIELQQPPNAYRGGDDVYQPPPGPPPNKPKA